jgi:hypothetical protein
MFFNPEKSPLLPNNELLEETVVKPAPVPAPAPFVSTIDFDASIKAGYSEEQIKAAIDYERSKYEETVVKPAPVPVPAPAPAPFVSTIDFDASIKAGYSEEQIKAAIDYEKSLNTSAPVSGPEFIDRINNPEKYPFVTNKDNSISTHKMAADQDEDGNWYAYPMIVRLPSGELKEYTNQRQALKDNLASGNVLPMESKEEALAYAENGYKLGTPLEKFDPLAIPPRTVEDTTFFERIKESYKRGEESFEDIGAGYNLAYESLTGDDEEANRLMAAMKAEEKLARVPTLTARDIQKTFNESGLWPAGKKVPSFMIEKIIESGPQMIVPMLVTGAATVAAAPFGPAAPIVGIASGIVTYGLQQFGNFMNTQGLSRDSAKDLKVGKAALNAAVAAPLGYAVDRFTLGLGKLPAGKKGKDLILRELSRRKFGKIKGAVGGAALGFIAEAPTEVLEAWLEREQADLPLSNAEAKEAYFESFWSAGAVGAGVRGSVSTYQAYKEDKDTQAAIKAQQDLRDLETEDYQNAQEPRTAEEQVQDAKDLVDIRLAAENAKVAEQKRKENEAAAAAEAKEEAETLPKLNKRTLEKLGLKETNAVYKRLFASFERGDDLNNPNTLASIDKALEEAKSLRNTDNDLIDKLKARIRTTYKPIDTQEDFFPEETVIEEVPVKKEAAQDAPSIAPGITSINQNMLSGLTIDPNTPLSEIDGVYEYLRMLPTINLADPVGRNTALEILTRAKQDQRIDSNAVDRLIVNMDAPQLRADAERGTQGNFFAEEIVAEEAPVEAPVEVPVEVPVEEAPIISVLDKTTLGALGLRNKHPVYKRLLNLFNKGNTLADPELRATVDKELIKAKKPRDTNDSAIDTLRDRIKNDYRAPEQLEFSRMYDPVLDRMLPRPLQDRVEKKVAPGDTYDLFNQSDKLGRPNDLWTTPNQGITSADTSINKEKLPASFNKLNEEKVFKEGSTNIDLGGGRFNNANDLLKKKGARNLVYDPFNRTEEHNKEVIAQAARGQSDTATLFNVLNVIEDVPNQIKVLEQANNALKPGGEAFISVYEGSGTGVGKKTSKGYQQNKKTKEYLNLVKEVFPRAEIKNGIIRARKNFSTFTNKDISTAFSAVTDILDRPSNNSKTQQSRRKRIEILRAVPNIETVPISSSAQDVAELEAKGRLGEYDVGLNRIKVTDLNDIDTLIHELFHAATAFGIRENINVETGRAKTPLGKEILELQKYIAEYLTNPTNEIDISSNPELLDIVTDIDELINAAINDPKVQKLLGEIPTPTPKNGRPTLPTMWDELVDIIRRVLNSLKNKFKGKAKNNDLDLSDAVLNDILAVVPELMIGPSRQIEYEYLGQVLGNTKKSDIDSENNQIDEDIKADYTFSQKTDFLLNDWVDFGKSETKELEKGVKKRLDEVDGLTKEAADQWMLQNDTFQVLRRDNLADNFLHTGILEYNEELKLWDSGQTEQITDLSYEDGLALLRGEKVGARQFIPVPSIAGRDIAIANMAKKNNISQQRAELITRNIFEALRHQEIFEHNKKVLKTVLNFKRTGQDKRADEYLEENIFIEHLSEEVVKKRLEQLKTTEGMQEVVDIWLEVRKKVIDLLVFSELLDANKAADWLDATFWVPFLRVGQSDSALTAGHGRLNLNTSIYNKKFRGSTREVQDILINQARWVKLAARNAQTNKKKIDIIDALLVNRPDLVQRVYPVGKKNTIDKTDTVSVIRIDKELPEWQSKKEGRVDEEGLPIFNKTTVHYYKINDPVAERRGTPNKMQSKIEAALTGVEGAALPTVTFLTSASNLLRLGVTLFPLFPTLQLFLRDTTTMAATSGVKRPLELYTEVFKELIKNLTTGSKVHEELKRYGITGNPESMLQGTTVVGNINDPGLKNTILKALGGNLYYVKEVRRMLEKWAMLNENAGRQGIYNVILRDSGDRQKAIFSAGKIIEYQRGGAGRAIRLFAAIIPFLKTTIQALQVLGNFFVARGIVPGLKLGKGARKAFVSRALKTLAGMQLFTLIYTAFMQDDEEYKKMTADQRGKSILIPGTSIIIPLRNDFFTLAWKTAPEMIYNYYFGLQDSRESKDAVLRGLREAGFFFAGMPQGITPVIQHITNTSGDFTGRRFPLTSERLENLRNYDKYNAGTSETSKLIARGSKNISSSTGIDASLSPIILDHYLEGATGYAGQFGTWVIDHALTNAGVLDVEPPAESVKSFFRSIPAVSGMLTPEYNQNLEKKWYELYAFSKGPIAELAQLQGSAAPSIETQVKLIERKDGINKRVIELKSRIAQINNDLIDIKKDIRKILDTPKSQITREEKRTKLEEQYVKKMIILSEGEKIRDYIFDNVDIAANPRKSWTAPKRLAEKYMTGE